MKVNVIGAGLAGSEAAWQLAKRGIEVDLYEMRPKKYTSAHKTPGFAELICSNSLRAASIDNAIGLLKEEMRRIGSIIMEAADNTRVEAGGALAVDRDMFSSYVTKRIKENELIHVITEEVTVVRLQVIVYQKLLKILLGKNIYISLIQLPQLYQLILWILLKHI